jgi:hypothetical protein
VGKLSVRTFYPAFLLQLEPDDVVVAIEEVGAATVLIARAAIEQDDPTK